MSEIYFEIVNISKTESSNFRGFTVLVVFTPIYNTKFFLFDSLRPSQQPFSYVGTGFPGLNQC